MTTAKAGVKTESAGTKPAGKSTKATAELQLESRIRDLERQLRDSTERYNVLTNQLINSGAVIGQLNERVEYLESETSGYKESLARAEAEIRGHQTTEELLRDMLDRYQEIITAGLVRKFPDD